MELTGIRGPPRRGIIGTIPDSRVELLKRVERWTHRRKIGVCWGLCAEIVTIGEVMTAHGLAQDEIDRWMEAYKRQDWEALKVGYRRKRGSKLP